MVTILVHQSTAGPAEIRLVLELPGDQDLPAVWEQDAQRILEALIAYLPIGTYLALLRRLRTASVSEEGPCTD